MEIDRVTGQMTTRYKSACLHGRCRTRCTRETTEREIETRYKSACLHGRCRARCKFAKQDTNARVRQMRVHGRVTARFISVGAGAHHAPGRDRASRSPRPKRSERTATAPRATQSDDSTASATILQRRFCSSPQSGRLIHEYDSRIQVTFCSGCLC